MAHAHTPSMFEDTEYGMAPSSAGEQSAGQSSRWRRAAVATVTVLLLVVAAVVAASVVVISVREHHAPQSTTGLAAAQQPPSTPTDLRCSSHQESVALHCALDCDLCDIGNVKLELAGCTTIITDTPEDAWNALTAACATPPAPAPAQNSSYASGRRLTDESTGADELWQVLSYSFVVDANMPASVRKMGQLFVIENTDVSLASEPRFKGSAVWSNSDNTRAEKLAVAAHIEGGYGPWSAEASMSYSDDSNTDIKTARLDVTQTMNQYRVYPRGAFNFKMETRLDPNAEDLINSVSIDNVEEISDTLGVFYARSANLGGMMRKTYRMQLTESDTQAGLELELKARHENNGVLIGGETTFGDSTTERRNGAGMRSSYDGFGGDPAVWLKPIPVDGAEQLEAIAEIQSEWAASFTDDNLYPTGLDLHPIWDIVKRVDEEKGAALQAVLIAKWQNQTADYNPLYYFGSGCTDPKAENYNRLIATDDGSCEYKPGCTNPKAENYDADATQDDGSCRAKCDPGLCRETDGVDNNCIVAAGSGAARNCAAGYVMKDLGTRDSNSWEIFNRLAHPKDRLYTCCSYKDW